MEVGCAVWYLYHPSTNTKKQGALPHAKEQPLIHEWLPGNIIEKKELVEANDDNQMDNASILKVQMEGDWDLVVEIRMDSNSPAETEVGAALLVAMKHIIG